MAREIKDAIDSAVARLGNRYGPSVAKIKELQQLRKDPKDGARVTPDGRITMPGELGHQPSGRYFAGGESPFVGPSEPPTLENLESENSEVAEMPETPGSDAFLNANTDSESGPEEQLISDAEEANHLQICLQRWQRNLRRKNLNRKSTISLERFPIELARSVEPEPTTEVESVQAPDLDSPGPDVTPVIRPRGAPNPAALREMYARRGEVVGNLGVGGSAVISPPKPKNKLTEYRRTARRGVIF